jgi:hypothetical protein
MPEREFFSLRNTVPGVTFILIIIGINSFPLITLLNTQAQGSQLFLGILTILTGSAIGFLITQFWWGSFERWKRLRVKMLSNTLKCITLKFSIANAKQDNAEALRVFDFISGSEDCRLSNYASRRWDMYHLLSATLYAVGLGLGLGVLIRVFLLLLGFPIANIAELLITIFTLLTSALLVALMRVNRDKCGKDYLSAIHSMILDFDPDVLAGYFPVAFFKLSGFENLDVFEEAGFLTAAMVLKMNPLQLCLEVGMSESKIKKLQCELSNLLSRNRQFHESLKL